MAAPSCCSASEGSAAGNPPNPSTSPSKKRSPSPTTAAASSQTDAKRLKLRPALTCTACKKRKIKCNRQVPCDGCIKRGEAALCDWDTSLKPERSRYALVDDLESLQQRLEFLESALRANPNSSAVCCPPSCSCHDASKTRSRGDPVAAAEDLPLSELIDLKLGFRRDLELVTAAANNTHEADVPLNPAVQAVEPGLSSIWMVGSEAASKIANGDRLATSRYFGKDHFVAVLSASLPQKSACDAILAAYFQDFDWCNHIVHGPSFHREYEMFWSAPLEWRIASTDPAWLALLLMMLAHGVRSFPASSMKDGLSSYSIAEVSQWPETFWECSQLALKQAQWMCRPQIRVLQTMLLYLSYLDFTNEGPNALIWIGAAAKTAHLLNLHRLADDAAAMPSDDVALPLASGGLKRQLAYRLWVSLLSAEMMACAPRQLPLSTAARDDVLKHLANSNDVDIAVEGDAPSEEIGAITDVTFETVKYRLATYQHRLAQLSREAGLNLSPFEVTSFDHSLRAILSGITEPILPPGGPPYTATVAKQIRRFSLISSAIHYRLLRLHRPYMSRGYTDKAYHPSTKACVDSALAILQDIARYWSASVAVSPFFTLHCIDAVLVVFVDVFWRMDHCSSAAPLERNKADLSTASALFEAAASSFNPQVEELARLGRFILSKLREEESMRSLTPMATREPLSEVFKRTAASVRTEPTAGSEGSATGNTPAAAQLFGLNTNPLLGAAGLPGGELELFGDFNFDWTNTYHEFVA